MSGFLKVNLSETWAFFRYGLVAGKIKANLIVAEAHSGFAPYEHPHKKTKRDIKDARCRTACS